VKESGVARIGGPGDPTTGLTERTFEPIPLRRFKFRRHLSRYFVVHG